MKRTQLKLATAALLALCIAAGAAAQETTQAEKDKALRYLADTRNGVTQAVAGLSEAQWNSKPGPDRWSVAEIVEHLAVLEHLFGKTICPQIEQSAAGKQGVDVKGLDAMVLAKVPDRSIKIRAPPQVAPTGRWSPQESLQRFLEASAKGPADWFTGTVRIDPLFQAPDPALVQGSCVTFEPGGRTAWHTHPLGQTLIVTAGCGWAQREGEPIEEIRPGDLVWFAPGERHWHGATPTTAMTHIAIQERLDGKVVDWMEKVTDDQYRSPSPVL